MIRALSAAEPPASFACGRPPQAERRGIDRPPLDPVGRHVEQDPAAVERQLVDPVPVDDERPLRPEERRDLGDRGRRPALGDADQLAGRARPGSSADR